MSLDETNGILMGRTRTASAFLPMHHLIAFRIPEAKPARLSEMNETPHLSTTCLTFETVPTTTTSQTTEDFKATKTSSTIAADNSSRSLEPKPSESRLFDHPGASANTTADTLIFFRSNSEQREAI